MLETYQARHPTPFAVLGIRVAGEKLAGIDYLPRGGIGGFMHSRRGPGIEVKRWLLSHEGVACDR